MSGRAGTAGSGDYYARRLASDAYRRSRVEKAGVIEDLIGERLRAADRIADLGTGTGIIKKRLERSTGKPILGFDIDAAFIDARERVVVADACRLPVRAESFEVAILNHLYEHVDDAAALFAEAWRLLAPGGMAYVSAGNRFAVMEPHYRLPFLSWLPDPFADRYLRWSRRGKTYEGVRFLTYGALVRAMRAPGFRIRDVTELALERLLGPDRGAAWRPVWAVLRRLPRGLRRRLLAWASPQWFFLLEKPEEEGST